MHLFRMPNALFTFAACAALALASAARGGEVIWDYGPNTGEFGRWAWNQTETQNFAEDVIFDDFMELTGIDIWTGASSAQGDMHVKILFTAPFTEQPGEDYLRWDMQHSRFEFDGNYGGTDLYKVSFDFDPVPLRANTRYWVGVSGNGWSLGQAGVIAPGNSRMALFRGREFQHMSSSSLGDQMFRLRGRQVHPPFEVALEGECPGEMTANVIGATPEGRVAFLHGQRGGETTIPDGPCRGVRLPVGNATFVRIVTADSEGEAQISGDVSTGCGTVAVVAVDLDTCEATEPARTYARPELYLGPRIVETHGFADFNDSSRYWGLNSYDEGDMNFRFVHTEGTFGSITYCGGNGTPALYMRIARDMLGVTRLDDRVFDAIEFNAGDGLVNNCFNYLWIRAYLEGVPIADFAVDIPRWQTVGLVGGEFDEIRVGAYSTSGGRNNVMRDGNERAVHTLAIDNVRFGALTPAPTLSVDATCPGGGPIRVEWQGATPDGPAALLFARETGAVTIPPNHPCAGTQLGLGPNQLQLAWQGRSDPNGSGILNATAPGAACGGYLQLLDISKCATSNVAAVE